MNILCCTQIDLGFVISWFLRNWNMPQFFLFFIFERSFFRSLEFKKWKTCSPAQKFATMDTRIPETQNISSNVVEWNILNQLKYFTRFLSRRVSEYKEVFKLAPFLLASNSNNNVIPKYRILRWLRFVFWLWEEFLIFTPEEPCTEPGRIFLWFSSNFIILMRDIMIFFRKTFPYNIQ